MKSSSTAIWFVIAALLFAAIWVWQRHGGFRPAADNALLPGFHADAVTGVQVIPAGELEIDAELTNGAWQLEKPYPYPAQDTAIQCLISRLEKLVPATRLSAAEIGGDKNADAEYGFQNPQYTILLSAGDRQWQLRVGKLTAPGDQVFVRLAGADGAFVTDTSWLQLLPQDASAWRDTALVSSTLDFNAIEITNGLKVIELLRDPTNHLWRMTRHSSLIPAAHTWGCGPSLCFQKAQLNAARFSQRDTVVAARNDKAEPFKAGEILRPVEKVGTLA